MKNNKNKPRIVLDTNVIVSAIVFGGEPRQILDLLAENTIIVVIAEELLTELRRKINTKFPDFITDLEAVEKLLKRDAILVKLGAIRINASRDPDDDKFIETAFLGNCEYVISGDKDLLAIGSYQNIKIIKPAEFFNLIENFKSL